MRPNTASQNNAFRPLWKNTADLSKENFMFQRPLVILIALASASCATLFGDKDRLVRVDSRPSGASVRLNGMPVGRTPATVEITSMTGNNTIEISEKGYESIVVPVKTSVQPIAFLNLLNILCWGIDFATGNVMRLDTKSISVDLEKRNATFEGVEGQFTIALADGSAQCQCAY